MERSIRGRRLQPVAPTCGRPRAVRSRAAQLDRVSRRRGGGGPSLAPGGSHRRRLHGRRAAGAAGRRRRTGAHLAAPRRSPAQHRVRAADVPAFGWRRFRLAPSSAMPIRRTSAAESRVARSASRSPTMGRSPFASATGGTRASPPSTTRATAAMRTISTAVRDGEVALHRRPCPSPARSDGRPASVREPRAVGTAALSTDRRHRGAESVPLPIQIAVRLVPGTERVDLHVRLANTRARPPAAPALSDRRTRTSLEAATTFDVARRETRRATRAAGASGAGDVSPPWLRLRERSHRRRPGASGGGGHGRRRHRGDARARRRVARAHGRPEPPAARRATDRGWPAHSVSRRSRLLCRCFAGVDPRTARDAELGLRAVAGGRHAAGRSRSAAPRGVAARDRRERAQAGGERPGMILRLLKPDRRAGRVDDRARVSRVGGRPRPARRDSRRAAPPARRRAARSGGAAARAAIVPAVSGTLRHGVNRRERRSLTVRRPSASARRRERRGR